MIQGNSPICTFPDHVTLPRPNWRLPKSFCNWPALKTKQKEQPSNSSCSPYLFSYPIEHESYAGVSGFDVRDHPLQDFFESHRVTAYIPGVEEVAVAVPVRA